MVFKIPDESSTLMVFGESRSERLDGGAFRVLVWNVWKGKTGPRWRRDFHDLAADRDLILLQEAVTDREMSKIFRADDGRHEWHMACSFEWRFAHRTGVITGALARPVVKSFIRGSERELFLWTPKVTLSTQYDIGGERPLMVINTHVVNFTTTKSYVLFVRELVGLIEHHQGPVLLAGDFNTWSGRRWTSLFHILESMGLEHVNFGVDPRYLKLDHVFVRGLRTRSALIRHDIRSSDHFPLLAEFEVP